MLRGIRQVTEEGQLLVVGDGDARVALAQVEHGLQSLERARRCPQRGERCGVHGDGVHFHARRLQGHAVEGHLIIAHGHGQHFGLSFKLANLHKVEREVLDGQGEVGFEFKLHGGRHAARPPERDGEVAHNRLRA